LSVGMAIDHRTGEFELAYAAFEFVGGGVRILHGKVGKSGIAVGSVLNLARQKIVGCARAANGERGIALRLHAGTRQPNHRAANAGLIHRGEPQVAEIGQPRQRLIPTFGRQVDDRWIPVLNEIGTEEMLLKGNLFDHAFSSGRRVEHASFRSLYLIMDIRYKRQFLGGTKQNKRRSSVAKTIRGVTFEENENNAMGLEFYNLSHRFGYQSPNWPYFEDVKIERIHYMAKSGVLSQRITTSMHNTTHIDAPAHVVQGTPFIDE